MRSADSAGAPEARFAEQGSAQAPARDRRLYARDQMGAAILPRPREAGLGQIPVRQRQPDRQSVVSGKGVSVRVDLGGRRIIKQTIIQSTNMINSIHT